MAVRMMTKNPSWVYIEDYDSEEEVFNPSSNQIEITPRKTTNSSKSWLNLARKEAKKRRWEWCKILPCSILIGIFAIFGLCYAIRDDMDTETNFWICVVMMICGSAMCVWLIYVQFYKYCKKVCSKDIKVSRVFNENNADDYIDIDY